MRSRESEVRPLTEKPVGRLQEIQQARSIVLRWVFLKVRPMKRAWAHFPPTVTASRLLTSSFVMGLLGYRNRSAFWEFVRRDGVPHIRFNARRIMFEEQALNDWLTRRSSRRSG